MNDTERIEAAKFNLRSTLDLIKACDAKASFQIAVSGVMLAALIQVVDGPLVGASWIAWLLPVAIAFNGACLMMNIVVVRPRIDATVGDNSVLYFAHADRCELKEPGFLDAYYKGLDTPMFLREVTRQLVANNRICTQKHKLNLWGSRFLIVATVFSGIFAIMVWIRPGILALNGKV